MLSLVNKKNSVCREKNYTLKNQKGTEKRQKFINI